MTVLHPRRPARHRGLRAGAATLVTAGLITASITGLAADPATAAPNEQSGPSVGNTPSATPSQPSASPSTESARPSAEATSGGATTPSTGSTPGTGQTASETTTPGTSSPAPSKSASSGTSTTQRRSAASAPITLAVGGTGSPKAGTFYQDIGSFVFSGKRADGKAGTVQIYRWETTNKHWYRMRSTTSKTGGAYTEKYPVTYLSSGIRFAATLGGVPGAAGVISSNQVTVPVLDSKVSLSKVTSNLNALKDPTISGSVSPARAGVKINIDVKRSDGKYRAANHATTNSQGKFSAKLTYGHASLKSYRIRTSYHAANRDRWETTSSQPFERTAVLDAKVAKTTSSDVAKTYRSGCPVGPSKLRTVSMNFYGMSDHKMHRGVIIIRSDLTDDLTRAFGSALKHRYPIAKINNPNVYGGNDPKQMEANNTSGFNCRKVTGNPYAQSPHSYGTALDVNTVQNPFRDVHGKWWPKNGKAYIKRSPKKSGMLTKNSYLTKSLRKDKFFWGGFWNPGRDYQHFER